MVLYRKYRPQSLADIVGQEHVRDSLLASLSAGKISHAFLFSGPRGTGKTSIARILAKAINCENNVKGTKGSWKFSDPCNTCNSCKSISEGSHLDIMEIDAASNRGIDDIRDLREKIKLMPSSANFKVYIIDEAHMLTNEAFNALLKTLEEPPEHTVFILATTEPQKIPATIASRSTQYDFKVPSLDHIQAKLSYINKKEGWTIADEALKEIAALAGGAFRDAEVLLEKVASADSEANLKKTREILGKKEITSTIDFLRLVSDGKTKESLFWLDDFVSSGVSVRVLVESVLDTLRKLLLLKTGAGELLRSLTEIELANLQKFEEEISKSEILKLVDLFNISISNLRDATIAQLPIEIAIIEATLDSNDPETMKKHKSNNNDQIAVNTPVVKDKVTGSTEEEKAKSNQNPTTKKLDTNEDTAGPKEVKNPGKVLKKLQEKWPQFLKEVKPKNSSVEMFLRTAKPLELDDGLLTIEFAYKFHRGKIEERKYRDVVETALEKFIGNKIRIKGVVSKKPPEPKPIMRSSEKSEPKEEVDPGSIFGTLD